MSARHDAGREWMRESIARRESHLASTLEEAAHLVCMPRFNESDYAARVRIAAKIETVLQIERGILAAIDTVEAAEVATNKRTTSDRERWLTALRSDAVDAEKLKTLADDALDKVCRRVDANKQYWVGGELLTGSNGYEYVGLRTSGELDEDTITVIRAAAKTRHDLGMTNLLARAFLDGYDVEAETQPKKRKSA